MTEMKNFNAKNITVADFERADRIFRERDYNYEVNISILFQLRSLINNDIRYAENKKQKFFEAMQRHDVRVFKRPEDDYPIHIGGRMMQEYLEVLRKIKSLGGTEFDEYWSE
ncbi:hypothetical protein ACE198_27680 [Neobacillus sp. KR4-4]|uniref:hypothetical protein n=1 Tax=Neobacillus sp. KR4-4 TaxID=3344872 RepID=UPI0035CB53C4